jgi:hypothetical protein
MSKINLVFEVTEGTTKEQLHELLRQAIHEQNRESLQQLKPAVVSIQTSPILDLLVDPTLVRLECWTESDSGVEAPVTCVQMFFDTENENHLSTMISIPKEHFDSIKDQTPNSDMEVIETNEKYKQQIPPQVN